MAAKLREHIDNDKAQKETEATAHNKKKGTLSGVFIPTCEGMWGVLIFLRFSYVVGIGGVGHALIAVFVSFLAALCTTICVSAIASSGGVVSEGGPYYMISRSLGPYVGVSVGITYWIGITFLGVMEAIGAVYALKLIAQEALDFTWATQALGTAIMAALSLLVFGGINLVTRLGVLFGLIVFLTIIAYYVSLGVAPLSSHSPSSYLTGLSADTLRANWGSHYPEGTDFGTLMSLFFPCFTGILAGADRSDVLKDPARNIRYGTMAAIVFSLIMYSSFMILWGSVADSCWLRGDCPATPVSASARRLSGGGSTGAADDSIADQLLWPNKYVVLTGVLISCCSQTLQCLIVAPRLLQAISADHLIPFLRPLAQMSKRNEPARALLATYILSAGLVLIGSVDILAPMVTIMFLVCYGFLNIACLMLTALRTPTWRPMGIFQLRYRVFYMTASVIGFLACLAISLVVSRYWTVGVVFFALFLYWYVVHAGEQVEWGSGMDGLRYGFALGVLLGLKREQHRKINWRPQILTIFSLGDVNDNSIQELASSDTIDSAATPQTKEAAAADRLVKFCGQLRKGRGMTVLAGVLEGCSDERTQEVNDRLKAERKRLDRLMEKNEISGFSEVVAASTLMEGSKFVCQLSGLGGLRPNTLVVPWPSNWRDNAQMGTDYLRMISLAIAEDKAVVSPLVLEALPLSDSSPEQSGHIDLWWFITDGGLLVLLTWLLAQHRVWRNCSVRVFVVVENVSREVADEAAETVRSLFRQKRILFNVTVEAVVLSDEMLQPYTYDLTLKMDTRRGLAPSETTIPHSLDELFMNHPTGDSSTQESSQPEAAATSLTSESGQEGKKRSMLKRAFSKAMHPRRTWRDRRARAASESSQARPPVDSVTAAFNRRGTVTEDNERDLLDTLNERCRQRRLALDDQRRSRDEFNDYSDDECESTVGELIGSQPTLITDSSTPVAPSSVFERLNQEILTRSKQSSLVLMNLPDIWGTSTEDCLSYLAFCECLTRGLDKVIFVHSSGTEIVRIF